jgi:hypothetical protein
LSRAFSTKHGAAATSFLPSPKETQALDTLFMQAEHNNLKVLNILNLLLHPEKNCLNVVISSYIKRKEASYRNAI